MNLNDIYIEHNLENEQIEFKRKLNRDNQGNWLKTVCGFANANGGIFFLGVDDSSSKLIGFDRKSADEERNYFNNQVNEHIVPRPVTHQCH